MPPLFWEEVRHGRGGIYSKFTCIEMMEGEEPDSRGQLLRLQSWAKCHRSYPLRVYLFLEGTHQQLIWSWEWVGGCVGSWRREMWVHVIHFIHIWNSKEKFKNPNSYSNKYLLSATVALKTSKDLCAIEHEPWPSIKDYLRSLKRSGISFSKW